MSTTQQQKKQNERAVERQEPLDDLVACWVPPVPTRWSAGYDYLIHVPVEIQRRIGDVGVYPQVHVVGRGRAEWAVLEEDMKFIRVRLAGIDLHEVIVRLHRLPRS